MIRLLTILIFVLTLPIFTFGQTKNYKDEFGKKQGVHIDTLKYGGFLERTYQNDKC